MKQALILGGNRFFGRHLALELLNKGYDLTLLNRGQVPDGLGDRVHRLKVDRKEDLALKDALAIKNWDLVVDQVCYDAREARVLCEALEVQAKTPRLVFTSTQSVYDLGFALSESEFNPSRYEFTKEVGVENYGEAKRQAETVFARRPALGAAMLRFPIVLGNDDYTKRLHWHVERVFKGLPIFLPNPEARIGFVRSDIAGKMIAHIAESAHEGPVNCACPGVIRLRDLMTEIEKAVGREANYASHVGDENGQSIHSPFGIEADWTMDVSKIASLGFTAPELSDWLPPLIQELAAAVRR